MDWSNHFLGSLWPVSWLSPDECLLGEFAESLLLTGWGLIEASRARRWCRKVTDCSGVDLRGMGWPRAETGGGWVPWDLPSRPSMVVGVVIYPISGTVSIGHGVEACFRREVISSSRVGRSQEFSGSR